MIWDALVWIATRPGGWVLPLFAVFIYLLFIWALLNMAGSEDEKQVQIHPEALGKELPAWRVSDDYYRRASKHSARSVTQNGGGNEH